MLGGIFGFIKYIIPIGTFAIGIYLAYDDKDYVTSKLIQYGIVILCICAVMSIYQISIGSIDVEQELGNVLKEAYSLGERNAGGGVIGTLVAIPFIKMFGMLGTVILALGITVVFILFIF